MTNLSFKDKQSIITLTDHFSDFIVQSNFGKESFYTLIEGTKLLSESLITSNKTLLSWLARCYELALVKKNIELQIDVMTICLAITKVRIDVDTEEPLIEYLRLVRERSKTLSMYDEETVVRTIGIINECHDSKYKDVDFLDL